MMCVMGCSTKESSPLRDATDWAIGTWSTTNIGGTTTWTISSSEIKMEFGGYITDYGVLVMEQKRPIHLYNYCPGANVDDSIIFTKVDGTKIKINIGGGDVVQTITPHWWYMSVHDC